MNSAISSYLKKRSIKGPWNLEPVPKHTFKYALVIPVYNELGYIDILIDSIKKQHEKILRTTAVVFVVNNSMSDNDIIKSNNKRTIELISSLKEDLFFVIDASTSGKEIAEEFAGVGFARKLGADLIINHMSIDSILLYTDADVLLDKNYLKFIDEYYLENTNSMAAVVGFRHQKSSDSHINQIIEEYERYLYDTAHRINKSGSPYGYVSIGSCITCRYKAYLAVGGMNKKKATEDFYFLNELAKFNNVDTIKEILVYPSSRSENRIYLGTGFHINNILSGGKIEDLYFPDIGYSKLESLIQIIFNSFTLPIDDINKNLMNLDQGYEFLIKNNVIYIIEELQRTSKSANQFINQFNRWFDALKTIKFIKLFKV